MFASSPVRTRKFVTQTPMETVVPATTSKETHACGMPVLFTSFPHVPVAGTMHAMGKQKQQKRLKEQIGFQLPQVEYHREYVLWHIWTTIHHTFDVLGSQLETENRTSSADVPIELSVIILTKYHRYTL
eukprot:3838038-Amphidinium_carterae.1